MVTTPVKTINLEAFLNLPETKPASEFCNGKITQKIMPQGEHSCLQVKLCTNINQVTEVQKIAYAFSELRCTFGSASIVLDISVLRWHRIPTNDSGRILKRFDIYPDWAIEILSPEQRQNKVLANLLHCTDNGTELGWLLDPEDENILVVFGDFVPNAFGRRIQVLQGSDRLPVLKGIELELTPAEIFGWLSL
jgi:Uma2 family endonuclease